MNDPWSSPLTQSEFDAITAELTKQRGGIVNDKRPDYTIGSHDVLANFKTAGKLMGVCPMICWMVYFWKHVSAIFAYVKNPDKKTSEPIQGRICDAINYLELLNALIANRNQKPRVDKIEPTN